jgi:hypothetical protein
MLTVFKAMLGVIAFIFFLVILILLLTWGFLYRTYRKIRVNSKRESERKARQYREETGRQRQQYGFYQKAQHTQSTKSYETTTGETIIDNRHQERENQKIFDDSDGEYVEYTEVES